jgi:phosphate transport system substrate-binding protein
MHRILESISVLAIVAIVFLYPVLLFGAEQTLSGAGATFPEPFYSKMFASYYLRHGTKIAYQGIGSGAGMRELIGKRVDFAGTDINLSEQDLGQGTAPLVRIPTCLGAVALIYNLPGNPKIRLTSEVAADILLGKIVKWNDPRIHSFNRSVKLPDMSITVVYRSDESGTTSILTDYLSKTSAEWRNTMGIGKSSVNWPKGEGAKGNAALAGMVRQIPGSIGYVELTYAIGNGMSFCAIRNKSGNFIEPSPETVTIAAKAMPRHDNGISLTDTSAPNGYPISGFTWIVLYKEQSYDGRSREAAEELVMMLSWITHEGQKYAAPLRYVPLPRTIVKKTESVVWSITYNGVPVMKNRR